MPKTTRSSIHAVTDSSLNIALTDKYTASTRQDQIRKSIREELLLRTSDLICCLTILLDINRANCPYRESSRIERNQAKRTINNVHKTRVRQSPPTSDLLSAYRDLHSYFFKTLDEMIFHRPANEIPRHQRTRAYSFAEDLSASDKTPVPLHYHCLIFSSEPRVRSALQDPHFRERLISKVQRHLEKCFRETQIKQSSRTYDFSMPEPTLKSRRAAIYYATKFADDSYLKNRHNQSYDESQQNYADESRVNQMIRSEDFLPSESPNQVKKIRNRNRRRSHQHRNTVRSKRINNIRKSSRSVAASTMNQERINHATTAQ